MRDVEFMHHSDVASSDVLLRSLLDASTDCIKVVEVDGTLVYLNGSAIRALGIGDPGSVRGLPWPDLWPTNADVVRAAIRRAAAGEIVRFHAPCPTSKGTLRWWDVVVAPMHDADGRIARLVSISRDVTAQAQVERTLRLALEVGRLATWHWDVQTGTFEWSPRHFTMLGYVEGQIAPSYDAWLARLHPDDRHGTARWIDAALAGEASSRHEFRFLHPDDAQVWCEAEVIVERDASDNPARVICVLCDATERKDAEMRSRDANAALEKRLTAAIAERDRTWNDASDLLLVLDRAGIIRAANPAWIKILGWTPDDLIGRTKLDFVHPDDQAATQEALELAFQDRLNNINSRCRRKEGGWRSIAWVTRHERGVIYACGRDVTEGLERAEALTVAEDALHQARRMEAVGQLTAGLAHDFNNLLGVIIANIEVVEGLAGSDPRVARAIRNAIGGVERGAALTQRLLAFARKRELRPAPVEVPALVVGLSALLQSTCGRAIRHETRLSLGAQAVLVDAGQLELALLNLAANARDAMPEGGQLVIEVDEAEMVGRTEIADGRYVRIKMTDTGAGMDEATLRRAAEPFFTTKPVGRGTGLGLAMVRELAVQSGGAFVLDSVLGRGTTAEVLLPLAHDLPPASST